MGCIGLTRKVGIDVCRIFVNKVMKLGKYWYDSLKKMKLCVCVSSYDIISVCAGYRWRTKQLTEGTEFQIHLYGLCKFLITIIGYALQRHKMRSHVKYAFTEYTHPNNLPYFFEYVDKWQIIATMV